MNLLHQREPLRPSALYDAICVRGLRFHRDESGATATEYVVLLVLVACLIIAVVASFGEQIELLYQMAVDTLWRDVSMR